MYYMPEEESPRQVTLLSSSLCQKYGFNDGAQLFNFRYSMEGAHDLLIEVVKQFLIPEIEKHHEIEVIDRIVTSHNPIRIGKLDGVEIDYYADDAPEIHPAGVVLEMQGGDFVLVEVLE
jgi:hypothetical protein